LALTLHQTHGDKIAGALLSGDQASWWELPSLSLRSTCGGSESPVSLFLGLDRPPDIDTLVKQLYIDRPTHPALTIKRAVGGSCSCVVQISEAEWRQTAS
jgi:hypothetical protein